MTLPHGFKLGCPSNEPVVIWAVLGVTFEFMSLVMLHLFGVFMFHSDADQFASPDLLLPCIVRHYLPLSDLAYHFVYVPGYIPVDLHPNKYTCPYGVSRASSRHSSPIFEMGILFGLHLYHAWGVFFMPTLRSASFLWSSDHISSLRRLPVIPFPL